MFLDLSVAVQIESGDCVMLAVPRDLVEGPDLTSPWGGAYSYLVPRKSST